LAEMSILGFLIVGINLYICKAIKRRTMVKDIHIISPGCISTVLGIRPPFAPERTVGVLY